MIEVAHVVPPNTVRWIIEGPSGGSLLIMQRSCALIAEIPVREVATTTIVVEEDVAIIDGAPADAAHLPYAAETEMCRTVWP